MKSNIYLTGLPRGGTTLISSILGQHSRIKQMGESMYTGITDPKDRICSCGLKNCSVLTKIFHEVLNYPEIFMINKVYGMIDRIREPNKIPHGLTIQCDKQDVSNIELSSLLIQTCNGIEGLTQIFRKVMGNFIFVDNTKEIMFAEELVKRDNWKILLITRDPRGMAWSSRKSGIRKNVPRPVSLKIPVYIDFARRAFFLKQNSKVFHLKYEDLCKDSINSIKNICNFLNITYKDELLNFKKDKGHTLMGNRMRLDNDETIKNDLAWKNNLTEKELGLINKNFELVELYKMLGYSLI